MITAVLWVAGMFLLLQVILLAYLSFSKHRGIQRERLIDSNYTDILNPYLTYLSGESDREPSLPSEEMVRISVMEKLLLGYASNIKGAEQEMRLKQAAQQHLSDYYRRILKKGSWAERVNVLYYIEDFKMDSLQIEVKTHFLDLRDRDEEYRQSLRVLAGFGDEMLIQLLKRDEAFSTGFIKELLRRLPSDSVEQLKQAKDLPVIVKTSMLSYFGETGHYEHLPYVEKHLVHVEKEIRLKAIAALCQYRYISSAEKISGFLTSEQWEERMYGARLAGILQLTRYSTSLMKLAGDPNWWVRFAACEALKQMPDGEILLTFAAEGHEDSYARDMARQLQTMKTGVMR
ncbi:hypothetical protein KP77_32990 [Jeotgalibacillus alimentarius]|uniref:HEAT repeat domain-containing protein n=1 Tax=Jeotgalibacillus alimentarius TaxID=135826 RepID=A0A0C2VHW9_9BACL|nr:hypothetical protein [Jeotgalibacillus alimentarius]KIL43593.1 hypothetical protein KP77_32990 [Jeotgalibacillus alimentarius]